MSQAHPMITPLPGVDPNLVAHEFPPDAAALFSLVQEAVESFKDPGHHTLEQAAMIGHGQAMKLLSSPLPQTINRPDLATTQLGEFQTQVVKYHAPEDSMQIDALLDWIAANRLMSPGRMASIFHELSQAGWIDIYDDGILISSSGKAMLRQADQVGMGVISPDSMRQWRQATLACSDGHITLDEAVSLAGQIFQLNLGGISQQISDLTCA